MMKNTGLEGRENLSQIVAFLANAAHSPQALPFAEANGKHIRHLPFASALKAIGKMANGE